MSKIKNWAEAHKDEVLSDNSNMCAQCKSCKYRLVKGFVGNIECGYDSYYCDKYNEKPREIMRSYKPEPCKYYTKDNDYDTA